MAARCAVCGKGPQTGFTVSHSHRRTKRSFRPNLQSVRTTIDGENTRLRVCVKCLRPARFSAWPRESRTNVEQNPFELRLGGFCCFCGLKGPCE